jgi:CMP-N-acetylneuraminic acid synthetase
LRPRELARDDTPSLPVVQHAVREVEARGECYDAVCLLQPTHPLRRAAEIDGCIALLERSGADAVVTVLPVPHAYNPHWVYLPAADGTLSLRTGEKNPISRRQELPPAFHREGSVYVTRRQILMEENSLYGERLAGYELDARPRINIDGPEDWERATALLGGERR